MADKKLGVIADDFTGASDIAGFLSENGLQTIQINGVPLQPLPNPADALVISLKSRSNPPREAVEQSLQALRWLQKNGCNRFYFKYCSTFDSSAEGNIGPVTDALLDALQQDFTVICPALPINGRTVFNGYLFVGNLLLNESGMQNHPITPMKDASLLRLMDAQAQGKTGLVAYPEVICGTESIKTCFARLKAEGYRYAVVDATENSQLALLAEAVKDFPLVTGGSGLAAYIARSYDRQAQNLPALIPAPGKTVILSGSCSLMTNQQVNYYKALAPSLALDAEQALHNPDYGDELYRWVLAHAEHKPAPMIYATVEVAALKQIQQRFGVAQISRAIEEVFACLAVKLKAAGFTNFIVAGGETSSIVVQRLGLSAFYIGKQIAPGVPWLKTLDAPVFLALKSGNFGTKDFFEVAQGMTL
ncbi:uncharacterized protein YgbK (DUF1537 family) [Mesocricetibacter intestinalis]|uniref:3-oxo-tetronate kinase n=1 Tax=Mesocricetibacter intestinalis TaxID=1521930 RepID=A0A4R6VF61_9PAST|nr:3-oxo-tetronate kinase [Mesocricetibacter intestinalis]TDQ59381.1 uncharacterized protein YgbK (DUF1537 family) [Mesocricetibacter intestinalis]